MHPALEARSLNHWTAREVPGWPFTRGAALDSHPKSIPHSCSLATKPSRALDTPGPTPLAPALAVCERGVFSFLFWRDTRIWSPASILKRYIMTPEVCIFPTLWSPRASETLLLHPPPPKDHPSAHSSRNAHKTPTLSLAQLGLGG